MYHHHPVLITCAVVTLIALLPLPINGYKAKTPNGQMITLVKEPMIEKVVEVVEHVVEPKITSIESGKRL